MKRPLLLSLLLMLALVGRVWAQNRTVSGRVIDKSTNEGLPGVSVIVKGTTTGTATNADGQYSLAVPGDANTLQFKYLGYVTVERPIGSSNTIDVGMDVDSKTLNEVVVTALGVPREKRALGYATAEVKSEQIVQKSEPDILRTLTGKVPGVNILSSSGLPGSSSRITIRGNSSFFGDNQPLFVVDGVPYDNSQTDSENSLVRGAGYSSRTADLDPNNIASINVLKGAAAAALYGSRAAGGVIVVTTKTGSGQRGAKGVQVGYSSGYSVERVARLPEYQNKYGSGGNFGPAQLNYLVNGSWGPAFGSAIAPTRLPHPQAGNSDLGIADTATIPYRAYPNNVKDYFNVGHLFENSVNLTGTGDNATFTTVLSRADQQGIVPNSSFTRSAISAGGSGKYNKFTIAGTVSYTNTEQRGPQLGANNAVGNATAFARTMFMPRNLDLQGLPYINPVTHQQYFGWLSSQADNPIWSTENNSYNSRVDRVSATTSLSYAFKDWLTLSYTGGINTYVDNRNTTVRPGSNGYGGIGNVIEDNIQRTELEQTLLLTFNKNLTEDISLRASIGQNLNQRKMTWLSYAGSEIIVFGIDNIENTASRSTNGYDYFKRRLMGLLGEATVGYKDFAFVTLRARQDWSSTLNRNNDATKPGKGYFYPSIDGALVVNEALKLDLPWLSLAKVRAAYARVGRDAPPYVAGPTYYFTNPTFGNPDQKLGIQFPFNGATGLASSSVIGNPSLKPEFTNELEVGGDLSFFKNRISIGGSYYNRLSTQQIAPLDLPSSSGYGVVYTNYGSIRNSGVELSLNVTPIETRGFRWNSIVNFTHNKNIVESLTDQVQILPFGSNFANSIQSVFIAGQPYGVFYGTAPARSASGELLINPTTGRLLQATEPQVVGNPNPQFIMGFINQFSYKGLTLGVLVDWRQGGNVYSTTLQQLLGRGVTKDTEDRDKYVIIDGILADPNTLKPLTNNDGTPQRNNVAISLNDYYFGTGSAAVNTYDALSVYDATTIRLREISLGYDVPKNWLSKTPIGQLNVSLSGRNLYWWSPNIPKYSNFDPESSTFGASNQQGFEYTNAPNTTRYGVNLRVTF